MANSKYTTIASKIRKAYDNQERDLLTEALKEMYDAFLAYQGAIEVKNKVCCPLTDRFLEILFIDSSVSKLTINPVDGRITLKISKKCTESSVENYTKLANLLRTKELPAITLRGKIEWHRGGYQCHLLSESKKHKVMIRLEENEIE